MDKEKKKQLMVKIGCVLASFCLWLYVYYSENPVIEKEIKRIPVELLNEDKLRQYNKVLYDDQEYYVSIIVEATESVMRQVKPSDFKVEVDLDSINPKSGMNTYIYKIVESPENVSISQRTQIFINIKLDELVSEKFDVKVDLKGTPKEGFYANTPEISLDDVTVEGAQRYIKTIKNIIAEVNVKDVEKDVKQKATLKAVDMNGEIIEDITIEPQEVQVTVPIGSTKEVPIEVERIGSLDSKLKIKDIKLETSTVKIKGEKQAVNNVTLIKTEPLDLTSITGNTVLELNLNVPENVTVDTNMTTVKVNIEVEKSIERQISSEVEIRNLNEKYIAELSNNNVVVTVKGSENSMKVLDYKYLEVYVDLANLEDGEHIVPIQTRFTGNFDVEIVNIDINPITVIIKSAEDTKVDGEIEDTEDTKENKDNNV